MQARLGTIFFYSAGALLLAMSIMLALSNAVNTELVQPHDPVFMISMHYSFFVYAGILLFVGLACLFGRQTHLAAMWVVWLAASFWIYQAGRILLGGHGMDVYLEGMPNTFGISARSTAAILIAIFLYLTIGGAVILGQFRWKPGSTAAGENSENYLKIHCDSCGGRIRFPVTDLGRETACPHCKSAIVLQESRNLKMACVLCGGHVEFPSHALGQQISCPHCAKKITLLLKLTI